MALTIRMRIDENDEHSYYYATGDGTEIELIPLVVNANGEYVPAEGKAYNKVTVTVPETELETLVVDANGTYNAPDGKAYNVVQVNVQQIINLQNKSASYTANGNYTIQADSGYDGLGTVSVAVDVPQDTPDLQFKSELYSSNGVYNVRPDSGYDGLSGVDVEVNVPATPTPSIQASKSQTITQNGTVTVTPDSGYDAMEEAVITVNVPTGGGGGNIVTGEFTTNSTAGEQNVDLPYNGNGYIVAVMICASHKLESGDFGFRTYSLVKNDPTTTPTYSGTNRIYNGASGAQSNTTSPTSSGSPLSGSPINSRIAYSETTTPSGADFVLIRSNKRLSLHVTDSGASVGFKIATKYTYAVVYSE